MHIVSTVRVTNYAIGQGPQKKTARLLKIVYSNDSFRTFLLVSKLHGHAGSESQHLRKFTVPHFERYSTGKPLHILNKIMVLNCGWITDWAGILQALSSMRYVALYKSAYIYVVGELPKQQVHEPHSLGPHLIAFFQKSKPSIGCTENCTSSPFPW